MTRTLTLIRHAKSSWKDTTLGDFERPLNKRGRQNAPMMGRFLNKAGISFDLVVTSPALRAITTARMLTGELGYPEQSLVEDPRLYGATVSELLEIVHQLPDEKLQVALVAHNPGLTEFCNYLSDEDIANLPTCGIASIAFELDTWQAVHRGTGKLSRFEYPRKYRD
jgi:phosphohistidine phosphatase